VSFGVRFVLFPHSGLDRFVVLQAVEAHEGGKLVSSTYRPPLPPVDIPFLLKAESFPRAIMRPEVLKSMKNPKEPIENRTHDLLVCSVMPQPTTLPRTYLKRLLISW